MVLNLSTLLKNRNIISKIKRSKVTDYAALNESGDLLSDTSTSTPSLRDGDELGVSF